MKTKIETNTFAAACYEQNTIEDLKSALERDRADAADCATWQLTDAEWRQQIQLALTQKIQDLGGQA